MLWRYQQGWYSERGWPAPGMMWNSRTGLPSVDILPESAGAVAAVVEYIRRTKGWSRRHYRIERRGPGVFPVAGGGQSVELQIYPVSHRVVKEVGGQ